MIDPRSRCLACLLPLLFALTACGLPEETDGPDPLVADGCDRIQMAEALPDATTLSGRPLLWRDCSPQEVTVQYGNADAEGYSEDECSIEIFDSRYEVPEGAKAMGMHEMLENSKGMLLDMARINVEMLVESRREIEKMPVMLELRGGRDYLPVVDRTRTGDPYVIAVPAKDETPGTEALLSVVKDRYVLTIECQEPVTGHDQAMALYAPFLGSLNLGILP